MEKSKHSGSSSSSFTMDLFGPKESSTSPLLGSIFAPQPTISSKDTSTSTPSLARDSKISKGNNLNNTVEPCYYNSSIYYGAQELYPSTNPNIKKDGGDADPNESNSNCASRGNWWKGSLYY
ncbi:uncharacterized protein LOC142538446 isoform X2 [Primulina tabacum]|uniref:uncharacterized protein LOC142538446 isoform X2 n=1 Tax=Primulina tabacum TaxID=48773 RepID=UPI003F5920E0